MRLDLQRADKQIPAGDIVAGLTRPMADRSPVADEDSIDLTILFDSGEATLKPAAEEQIHQLALALTSDELKGKTFLITGHADSTGDTEANMKLSLRRACTVRDALLADKAILPKQLICVGKGQTETRYPEHTPDANRLNRRVQIALLPENSPHKPTGSLVQPPPSPTKLNRDSTAKEPFRGPTVYAH